MIDVVTATRLSEAEFWSRSALGLSLRRLSHEDRLRVHVAFENRDGLPLIYNGRLAAPDCAEYCAFVHDDVWLDDFYLADRIVAGLNRFDVIGLAGNRFRAAGQPSWAFVEKEAGNLVWDDRSNLSGAIGHGEGPFGLVSVFGEAPASCELLDGVFLAVRSSALRDRGVQFDPRFQFHFYDLDFCRGARQHDLDVGTWPICMTHQSSGAFGTPAWHEGLQSYRDKWGD